MLTKYELGPRHDVCISYERGERLVVFSSRVGSLYSGEAAPVVELTSASASERRVGNGVRAGYDRRRS